MESTHGFVTNRRVAHVLPTPFFAPNRELTPSRTLTSLTRDEDFRPNMNGARVEWIFVSSNS